jgi:ABC-type Fe3+ transport system substrate-binding protein
LIHGHSIGQEKKYMDENPEDPIYIIPDHSIRSVLNRYPELEHLFESYGLAELKDAPSRSKNAVYLTLADALCDKKIDCIGFIALAKEHVVAYRTPKNKTLAARSYNQRDLQFLGLMPCPVKIPFDSAFAQFISRKWRGNPPFSYLIESNANNQLAYYNHIPAFKNLSDMPDIVISPGLNGYYHRFFFDHFRKKKYFSDVMEHADIPYDNFDLRDPDGYYSMLGANIDVMVVDNTRIGDRKIPERWTDLLLPEFQESVAIRGQDGFFCETVLLTLYKETGLSGVRTLARSIASAVHPAQMVKNAGSKAGGAAVSIMPLFFANLAKKTKDVTIVWPDDGAIVSPVTMIVKRKHREDLDPLISYLAGKETGSLLSGVHFPSMAAGAAPCVPRDAAFNWIGWDYIREHDIGEETEMLGREFAAIYNGKSP